MQPNTLQCTEQPSKPSKNYLAQDVNSALVVKPWTTEIGGLESNTHTHHRVYITPIPGLVQTFSRNHFVRFFPSQLWNFSCTY